MKHLEMLARQGKPPRKPARWLVTAIKEDYPVSSAEEVEAVAVLSYSEAMTRRYQQRATTLSGEQAEAIERAMLAQEHDENVRKSA